jgi:hypothetical protein
MSLTAQFHSLRVRTGGYYARQFSVSFLRDRDLPLGPAKFWRKARQRSELRLEV